MAREGICHIVGAADLQHADGTDTPLPGDKSLSVAMPIIRSGDLCLAADGGWQALEKLGISPDLVVGDFDSSEAPEGMPAIRLNPVKDVTDLYAAVQIGKGRGYRDFRLYGALGGSWGHSAANLQILAGLAREGCGAVIIADGIRAAALSSSSMSLSPIYGRRVSILAFGGTASGVTLKGMRYPLNNAELDCFFPLGVSNSIIGDEAEISVTDGMLLIIQEQSEI
ncbi:MAG: thiamine diphosphokinase [Oscillospiraceae bacterium]|jgi:thiamine pyrophosphokinase|nr:thiamine diphosphokinase [Oscillospiraceae bacterium]